MDFDLSCQLPIGRDSDNSTDPPQSQIRDTTFDVQTLHLQILIYLILMPPMPFYSAAHVLLYCSFFLGIVLIDFM